MPTDETEDKPTPKSTAHGVMANLHGALGDDDHGAFALALCDGVRAMVEVSAPEGDAREAALEACDAMHAKVMAAMPEEADDEEGDTSRALRRFLPGTTRKMSTQAETVDGGLVVFTTDTVIENGDILDLDSLKTKRLLANPVLLWNHSTYTPPIGTFDPAQVRFEDYNGYKRGLFRPVFHRKTQLGIEIADLWDAGVLRTVSIGFIPSREPGDTVWRCDLPKEHKYRADRGVYFRNAHAYEISVVTVPGDELATKIGRRVSPGVGTIHSDGEGTVLRFSPADMSAIGKHLADQFLDQLVATSADEAEVLRRLKAFGDGAKPKPGDRGNEAAKKIGDWWT